MGSDFAAERLIQGGDHGQGILGRLLSLDLNPAARDAYTKLAVPAVLASGGRFLARGLPAKTYEGGIDQRTVLVEFDSLAQAIDAHNSPGYQAGLAVLGNAAERDLRIVEGIDG
jgi:uncharacterized protein (DUF1330 family)